MPTLSDTKYERLRKAIAGEISRGTEILNKAFQIELVKLNWNIGRILNEEGILTGHPNAENAKHIAGLVKDFKRPDSFFYDVAKFYRLYSKKTPKALSWSHYSLLIRVDDPKQRKEIEKRVVRDKMSSKDLRVLLRCPEKDILLLQNKKLLCERGQLYHYKVINRLTDNVDKGWMIIDLGFSVERAVRYLGGETPHSGLIVRSVKESEEYFARISSYEKDRLYTYKIDLDRVIDGDTIVARVNMGFRSWSIQRLRLRGIDTPEKTTALGLKAKNEVKKRLESETCLIVRTYKQGKYGRFLADVFYKPGCDDPQEVLDTGIFLNQELLDLGLAVFYDGGAKELEVI